MFEYLEYLRSKPRKTRKRIAMFVASSLSMLIFTGWMFSRISPVREQHDSFAEATQPIALVANSFLGFKQTTKELTTSFQDEMYKVEQDMIQSGYTTTTFESMMSTGAEGNPPNSSSSVKGVPLVDPYSLPPDTPTEEATNSETTI